VFCSWERIKQTFQPIIGKAKKKRKMKMKIPERKRKSIVISESFEQQKHKVLAYM